MTDTTDEITDVTSSSISDDSTVTTSPDEKDDSISGTTDASSSTRRTWLTDTLHTIIERALAADKPDIKGALAALAMLAETDESAATSTDIADVIRTARRRAARIPPEGGTP